MTARDLLRPLLARRLSPAERRAVAAELRQLADEQLRLADADEAVGHRVRRAAEEAAPRTGAKGGRPKGSGGSFVRWQEGEGRSGRLHIAARLWRDLGSPGRLDVQRLGAEVHVRPCGDGQGWAVTSPTGERGGLPRLAIGQGPADDLRLIAGRWKAEICGGAIVARMG